MPNYVKNKVIVQHEKLEDIANFMEGEDGAFDFNNLVPMPEEYMYMINNHALYNVTMPKMYLQSKQLVQDAK